MHCRFTWCFYILSAFSLTATCSFYGYRLIPFLFLPLRDHTAIHGIKAKKNLALMLPLWILFLIQQSSVQDQFHVMNLLTVIKYNPLESKFMEFSSSFLSVYHEDCVCGGASLIIYQGSSVLYKTCARKTILLKVQCDF